MSFYIEHPNAQNVYLYIQMQMFQDKVYYSQFRWSELLLNRYYILCHLLSCMWLFVWVLPFVILQRIARKRAANIWLPKLFCKNLGYAVKLSKGGKTEYKVLLTTIPARTPFIIKMKNGNKKARKIYVNLFDK